MEHATQPNQFIFEDRPRQLPETSLRIEGTIPGAVKGRFLFNGAGQMRIGGRQLHAFDAYGRVVCVSLGPDEAVLQGHHVTTPLYAEELETNQVTKRRLYANKPSRWSNLFDLDLGNSCNHNVYAFGPHVIASQDPGHFILDERSLEVEKPFDCGGLHKRGMNMTPMPRVDPATGRLVLWLQKPGPKDQFIFAEVDEKLKVAHQRSCKLPAGLRHDIAFTDDYYIVTRFAGLNVPKVLWGASPVFGAVTFNGKTSVLHLVPRRDGKPREVLLPDRMHFHYFNAFQEDGAVVLDTIGYRGGVTFSRLLPDDAREKIGVDSKPTPVPEVVRYRIDTETLEVDERVMPGIACEAPEINPAYRGRPHRYGYASAKTSRDDSFDEGAYIWFGGVAKLDFQDGRASVWSAPAGATASPPAFVADPERSGEDAGYLLSWVQDPRERRSCLVILDAQNLAQGPVAKVHHDELFGLISHVSWAPPERRVAKLHG